LRLDFIKTLHCPFSGSRFSLSNVSDSDSVIENAIITSEAGDFPIIDGILRLKTDQYRWILNDLIRKGQLERALLTAMDVPSYGRGGATLRLAEHTANKLGLGIVTKGVTTLKRPLYRALTDKTETLTGTAKRVDSKSWADWQIYRFSMPAFLPTYPILHLIETDGPVLDFGSGVGHAAFLMSRRTPGANITCADFEFTSLYLARKFFVQDGNFICVDGNYLLPFRSEYFSFVFSTDVVHTIDSKLSLCQEFRRIVSNKGVIVLPHLHNKLSPIDFGKPLTPEGYSTLFEGMERRIVPEDWMVDEFICNDSVDLGREWTQKELHSAIKGLSLIASRDRSLFRDYRGLWKVHTERMLNPILNPAYQVSGRAGQWTLEKGVPDSHLGKVSAGRDTYLPNKQSLSLTSLDAPAILALKASDPAKFSELARKFIIVDVPERFQ
jgi:SAM-dependent methyltransferase